MLEGSQPRSLRACSRDDPECGARLRHQRSPKLLAMLAKRLKPFDLPSLMTFLDVSDCFGHFPPECGRKCGRTDHGSIDGKIDREAGPQAREGLGTRRRRDVSTYTGQRATLVGVPLRRRRQPL